MQPPVFLADREALSCDEALSSDVPALGAGQHDDVRFQRRAVGQEDGRLHGASGQGTSAR